MKNKLVKLICIGVLATVNVGNVSTQCLQSKDHKIYFHPFESSRMPELSTDNIADSYDMTSLWRDWHPYIESLLLEKVRSQPTDLKFNDHRLRLFFESTKGTILVDENYIIIFNNSTYKISDAEKKLLRAIMYSATPRLEL